MEQKNLIILVACLGFGLVMAFFLTPRASHTPTSTVKISDPETWPRRQVSTTSTSTGAFHLQQNQTNSTGAVQNQQTSQNLFLPAPAANITQGCTEKRYVDALRCKTILLYPGNYYIHTLDNSDPRVRCPSIKSGLAREVTITEGYPQKITNTSRDTAYNVTVYEVPLGERGPDKRKCKYN